MIFNHEKHQKIERRPIQFCVNVVLKLENILVLQIGTYIHNLSGISYKLHA